ncbi:hypothetical protein EVAR_48345_1 [Eumeta japonica]|uniref:Uncharacterized protein n=1 Tax=Eumeta variegata TaxID=151549 RepID=A0A4C1WL76_EUMVA|nr:hypothetical protein EVAR_48345_1 [Eumeta japonica]
MIYGKPLSGVSSRLMQALQSLYRGSSACLEINGAYTDWFDIRRVVGEECEASTWLFNLFMDRGICSFYTKKPFFLRPCTDPNQNQNRIENSTGSESVTELRLGLTTRPIDVIGEGSHSTFIQDKPQE